jgi:hypothetical protein
LMILAGSRLGFGSRTDELNLARIYHNGLHITATSGTS